VLFTALLARATGAVRFPEAESELVAGFVTEYSGARYLFFFLVEWGNLYIIGALMVTLFLGGWQVPPVTDNVVLLNVLQFLTFFLKSYLGVLIIMWIRATLPRIRVDQLMSTCLEVPGADRLRGLHRHGGLGRDLAERQPAGLVSDDRRRLRAGRIFLLPGWASISGARARSCC
jgi:hypothetical protein